MVIEVCCCLGLAANVAQLAGLDVITLVKVIKSRVETVRQNKEDCELLAERANMIRDLLRRVQASKVIEDPDMWKPTEGLKSTLRRAGALVKSCQEEWSYAYRFCKGRRIARELRKVLKDLKFYILLLIGMITIINHDQNTRYYRIPETDIVKPQDGAQEVPSVALGLPAHNYCNDMGQTTGSSGQTQLVTEPSIVNEGHLPENQRSGCCWWWPWKRIATASNAGNLVALEETGLKKFTFSELEVATDNFSLENQIGVGAFSIVYKGQLNEIPEVAVKRASYVNRIPFEQLENEAKIVSKLQHTNIVKLLGYCIQDRERILVFEYMPSRSLDSFITGERAEESPLDWSKRSQIVKGIAEGAEYLHKQCEPRIIHGDLKPGNILLDAALKPKICDFGTSKALRPGQDMDCTGIVVGSRGYMAPEYKQGGCVSLKTDVYSFGATLLEIIRGSRIPPSTLELSDESRDYGPLNKWAWNLWRGGNQMEFIDPSLRGDTLAAAEIQSKEELRYNRRLRRVIREENAISQRRTLEVFQKSLDNACQNLVNHINCSLQSLTARTDILHHEVEQLKRSNSNRRYRSEANREHAAIIEEVNQEQTVVRFATSEAHEGQRVELRFLNKLNEDAIIYTKDKITADDGNAIKIAIYKDNQIVRSGQLSSARIQILALHGNFNDHVPENWTEGQFDERIVKNTKGPVLGGVCQQVKLKNGEASLSDVYFDIPSGKTESGKLILAAKVHCSDRTGLRIKEAVTNPVKVQVHRNKHNRNSDCPKLKDEVYRLKGISRTGGRFEWLKNNQIYTVEDFLKALNKNEEKIRTDAVICLKQQAYDVLDGIHFDHKMEENGPVSLFSAMNTSIIGGDASVPFTDTAGQNPPDFHVAYREVETAHHANIYQAHELPQAFRNNNNAFGTPGGNNIIPTNVPLPRNVSCDIYEGLLDIIVDSLNS
uniref:non-specific serine/threonine protein kinase n=1 Tax=Oryza nivara TaxID=4536 RepID=A0A0E0J5A1_ORYNI